LGRFTITDFVFGAAEEIKGCSVQDTYDGVFGMAPTGTHEGVEHTFLDGLFQRSLIDHREFGLFFREAMEGRNYMVIGKVAREYMPREAYPVRTLNEPGLCVLVFQGHGRKKLHGYW
ncbi:hypothetical protein T265_13673, partial [Opisthorchis viverrini]